MAPPKSNLVAVDILLAFQSPSSVGSTSDTSFKIFLLPVLFLMPILSYLKYRPIVISTPSAHYLTPIQSSLWVKSPFWNMYIIPPLKIPPPRIPFAKNTKCNLSYAFTIYLPKDGEELNFSLIFCIVRNNKYSVIHTIYLPLKPLIPWGAICTATWINTLQEFQKQRNTSYCPMWFENVNSVLCQLALGVRPSMLYIHISFIWTIALPRPQIW